MPANWISRGSRKCEYHYFMGNEAQNAIGSLESAKPAASQTSRFRPVVSGGALIFLLTFAAYWPVLLRGHFIWDDPLLVEKNPLVTHTLNLRTVWFQTDFPFTVVSFWLQWLCWGKAAAGYHTVNILLHAINSILVWRVLRRLNIRGAWLAGAIFAVHPVCAASVAWISELKNTLSLPFFILSIGFYLREDSRNTEHATRNTQNGWYVLSLLAFLLALLAKTSTVMLPVVLLGCAWWRRGRITKQDWLRTAPFFVLALAFALMSIWFQTHQTFTTGKVQTENFWGRLAGAGMAAWFYLGKALLPLNLNLIYPRWNINATAPLSYFPALLLCGAFVLFWKFRRSWGRPVLFGFGFFVVNLFPVLGFFDMYFLAISHVSDHFQYLALIGIVGLIAGGIYVGVQRLKTNGAELLIKATLIVALAFLTMQRAKVMATDESLWRDTLAKNPAAWSAHNNLACILAERNKIDEAITHFDASLRLYPNNAQAHGNLGKALTLQNKFFDAEAHLRTAVALKPQEPEFHRSLAYALGGEGKTDEALGQLRQAADLQPGVSIRLELAGLLHQLGKDREAIAEYRRALAAQSLSVEVLNNVAWILATSADDSARNGADAVRFAEKACQQTQNQDATTMGTLAAAYAEVGRFSDAVATAEKAANLANAAGNTRFATVNMQLMQLYRGGKPYHEKASPARAP
jgi:Flp pilus assembly protein TadD